MSKKQIAERAAQRAKRDLDIWEMRKAGFSAAEVVKKYGLGPEMVNFIFRKMEIQLTTTPLGRAYPKDTSSSLKLARMATSARRKALKTPIKKL